MKQDQWKYIVVDDVMVAVGTTGKLPDDAWRSCLNEISTQPIKKFLTVVLGTIEVSSVQRKIGIEVVNKRAIKVAVVNDSSIIRGIVTAASWFSVDVSSFPLTQIRDAVRALGVPPSREGAVVEAVEMLRASLT